MLVQPGEPILEIHEIQGHILPGFNKDFQILLFLEIVEVCQIKDWLRQIHPRIVSLETVLNHQQLTSNDSPNHLSSCEPSIWINIAFSFNGLSKLTNDADLFIDAAFKDGLHNRSELLGDPTHRDIEGNCHNWVIGSSGNIPDIILIIAADDNNNLVQAVNQIEASLNSGFKVIFKQAAAVLLSPFKGHEHFGFRDCISQPCVRGRISNQANDFLTPRFNLDNAHQEKITQDLIWPGEFIFGYPRQSPIDKLLPGAIAEAGPSWAPNGSFLVFRRLRQDVEAFQTFTKSVAKQLREKNLTLEDITSEKLAAKLMGRWFSGTPIIHAPNSDNPEIAQESWLNNHFVYENSSQSAVDSAVDDVHLLGDTLGIICPHAAHIRKAFPRDTKTLSGSEADTQTHRLLRRGIPFGQLFCDDTERGLLFLAYQTSIERQFEFITTNWINNPNFPDSGAGHDPIVGQNNNLGENRVRSWNLPVKNPDGGVTKISVKIPIDWVIPTGGGYFFAPSISALNYLSKNH
ncbi:peroxidase [Dulcicalothrix desertica PCC 7102]|uniref:Peroxidase n=1 Tax=Dulcicalothrix desertica PCC 7102 TaxID=232991 RepID=A0A433V9P4_9CYAN|nr:Dyp-type peroxidase [Dulcicalothrix desertica]RUT02793.1 peroxidase [Dulcicalothrix desertica PCC 7102]TWH38973.1 Dyp-type peroxidase family [Dulcicalothrix desertica PCC 7102]